MKKETKIITLAASVLLVAIIILAYSFWMIAQGIKREYQTPNQFTDYVINEKYDKAYNMFRDDHKKVTSEEDFEQELKNYGLNKKCKATPKSVDIHSENDLTKKEISGNIECQDSKKFNYTVTLDGKNQVIGFIVNRVE